MPTIKDVALRSGVSTATVSHVVNGTRFVQPATRDRVLASIRDLGYESDGIARSLRVRSTSLLALIVPDLSNPFFPELAMAVQEAAVRSQYDVVMCSVDVPHGSSEELLQHHLRTVRQKRYDGVIFAESLAMKPSVRHQLMATGVPVVLIGGTPHPEADRVYIDDYAAARDVMEFLIRKGHASIGHITGVPGMASTTERRRGYRDALRSAALPQNPDLEVAGTFLRDGGYAAMQNLLACSPRPTAVFAANDLTAVGALAATLDAALRVPEDMAIVGFDDIAIAADLRPALTTVYHGQREMGEEAVRLVLSRLRGDQREGPPVTTIVPHRMVVRDSA